ncbi:MAG TPA: hypothetical protein PKJ56_04865 [Promineifilum sp.]|nr:hypothetical protein [Promineifilum sp.]
METYPDPDELIPHEIDSDDAEETLAALHAHIPHILEALDVVCRSSSLGPQMVQ